MTGEPIEAVKNGMKMLVAGLRQDPYALETTHLSVISFNHEAKQEVPLTELSLFQEPILKASGQTGLGEALVTLSECIDREVLKTSPTHKGDWKPLIFLMTDGLPTDDWKQGLKKFENHKCAIVVACAVGPHANTHMLKEITSDVVQLDTADSNSIQAFFKWVSSSISVSNSISAEGNENKDTFGVSELPPPPPEVNIVV